MNMFMRPSVCIIGLGVWGKHLVRVATQLDIPVFGFDHNRRVMHSVKLRFPKLQICDSFEHVLNDDRITGIVIATPPLTHYTLAARALRAGKHVLIEKPMVERLTQVSRLQALSLATQRSIMIDHTYVFSPALNKARTMIQKGAIGTLQRIESIRYGGRAQTDITILSDFVPHDVSIALFLTGQSPTHARTMAAPYTKHAPLDHAIIELTLPHAVRYLAWLSWDTTIKTRKLTIIGSRASLTISWQGAKEALTLVRGHARKAIHTAPSEPLSEMMKHFVYCITNAKRPITHEASGYTSIQTISALHASWKRNGARITI